MAAARQAMIERYCGPPPRPPDPVLKAEEPIITVIKTAAPTEPRKPIPKTLPKDDIDTAPAKDW